MADILDSIDDLEDDDFEFDLEELEDDETNTEVGTFDTSVDLYDFEMTPQQAQDITDAIRSAATATFVLLSEAHKHKAHKALGYDTWAEYVKQEFQISTQRSYQLLALSSVANEIEESLPEGASVKLTEKQARDIKRELPKITEQIREETSDMSPADAAARAAEIVDQHRDEIKAQKEADEKSVAEKEKAAKEAEEEAYRADLEAAADALLEDSEKLLEADRADGMTDHADDGLIELEIDGENETSISSEDSMSIYNFFNVLTSISSLPEPEKFLAIVPASRAAEIENELLEATSWLNRFQTLWELREES